MNIRLSAILAGFALVAGIGFATGTSAQIERVSVGPGGIEANADSYDAAISANGQVIAFRSTASNLVAGDDNNWPDIFVRDLGSTTTEMASGHFTQNRTYSRYPSISDDGQVVVMQTDLNESPYGSQIIAHDRGTGVSAILAPSPRTEMVGNQEPSVSGNGQFVAFFSEGTLKVIDPPEARPINDDHNDTIDSFVYDRVTVPVPQVERVSRDAKGAEGVGDTFSPTLSDDGRYVAFYSYANNLVPGDTNEHEDIFVKDRQTAGIVMASVASDGTIGNGDSYKPVISGNGKFVVFRSQASNLVAGDTNKRWDIFVRDLTLGQTSRVSVSSSGAQANHDSLEADISDDGRFVVFRSNASNLVADDVNKRSDVFVHDRQSGQTVRVSKPASGESNGHSTSPVISGDGAFIAFESVATNLVPGDTNKARDIFRVANPLVATNVASNGGN